MGQIDLTPTPKGYMKLLAIIAETAECKGLREWANQEYAKFWEKYGDE